MEVILMLILTFMRYIDQYLHQFCSRYRRVISYAMADTSESERDFIILLITLYRDSPELWKVKSKDYFNQAKKQMAMKKIVDALISFKQDFTVEKLKKKINSLRTNFNKDYKAIESAKRSGASTDDIPKPKSWYYEDMMFIKDQLEIAETDSSEVSILFMYYYLYKVWKLLLLQTIILP